MIVFQSEEEEIIYLIRSPRLNKSTKGMKKNTYLIIDIVFFSIDVYIFFLISLRLSIFLTGNISACDFFLGCPQRGPN